MAAYFAQILVGGWNRYHGGIKPGESIYLSENSRPAWILHGNVRKRRPKIVWIPTLETPVREALAMIAIHLIEDEKFIAKVKEILPELLEARVELYDVSTEAQREEVWKCLEEVDFKTKVVLSILEGCLIKPKKAAAVLQRHNIYAELCVQQDFGLASMPNEFQMVCSEG